MTHTFDTEVAKEYGVDIAIVVNNIAFWLQKNKANGKHIHDGKVWTYNSTKAFKELFPYWTENQIRRILENMQKHGIIETGNYNSNAYDRTKWYTFTNAFVKTHASICEFCQMDSGKQPNGFGESNEPIPDNKPINKTDNNTYSEVCTEIIDYLNEKCSSRYRATDSTKKLIRARLEEGFTKDDCFTVIDNKVKTWKGTEWERYLRPSTLFNASKFQGYLNEKEFSKQQGNEISKELQAKGVFRIENGKYFTERGTEFDPFEDLGECPF